jgi:hypothetical protein
VLAFGALGVGPPSTTTDTTFEAAGTVLVGVVDEVLPGGSPPPHDVTARTSTTAKPPRKTRVTGFINGSHPG